MDNIKLLFRISYSSIIILLLLILQSCSKPYTKLDYADPVDAGFSEKKISALNHFCDSSGTSSLLILYDGKIIFEWGDINRIHTVHSIRKALLNSLLGIYIGRGLLDTNSTLKELNIDDIYPSLNEMEKSARVVDLLKSRSGVYHPAAAESKYMSGSRPERGSSLPGESYYYNNWDFNTLGYILERVSGKSIYDIFREEIAGPIGMKNYEGKYTSIDKAEDDHNIPDTDGFYQFERDKSKYPAYHFRMSAYDLALYGLLYLNEGKWKNNQVIPEEWIKASTKAYSIINPNIGIGYGMLWRVLMRTDRRKSKSYYHTGVGIHMLGIYPSSKLVLVHRVDTENEYDFPTKNLYKLISLIFST